MGTVINTSCSNFTVTWKYEGLISGLIYKNTFSTEIRAQKHYKTKINYIYVTLIISEWNQLLDRVMKSASKRPPIYNLYRFHFKLSCIKYNAFYVYKFVTKLIWPIIITDFSGTGF